MVCRVGAGLKELEDGLARKVKPFPGNIDGEWGRVQELLHSEPDRLKTLNVHRDFSPRQEMKCPFVKTRIAYFTAKETETTAVTFFRLEVVSLMP